MKKIKPIPRLYGSLHKYIKYRIAWLNNKGGRSK